MEEEHSEASSSQKDCYMKALDLDPKLAHAWANLGAVGGGRVGGIQYSEKDCYIKALECEPRYAKAWNNLGNMGGG